MLEANSWMDSDGHWTTVHVDVAVFLKRCLGLDDFIMVSDTVVVQMM